MTYDCLDSCGKTYQSLKAAMSCDCDRFDAHGYERQTDSYEI